MSKTDTVHDAIVPVVASLGLDLYDLEMNRGVLRISLTKRGGINLDELAQANNAIGAKLDELDPFSSRYTLEVSSPGLERKLRTPEHFAQAQSETVKIRTLEPSSLERRLDGVVVDASQTSVTIETQSGDRIEIPFDSIERARTTFAWGSEKKVSPSKAKVGAGRREKSVGRKSS
jgi:ribosome maturation factor RimP